MESRCRWLCAPHGWTAQCYRVLPLQYSRALVDCPIDAYRNIDTFRASQVKQAPSSFDANDVLHAWKTLIFFANNIKKNKEYITTHPSLRKQPCAPSKT